MREEERERDREFPTLHSPLEPTSKLALNDRPLAHAARRNNNNNNNNNSNSNNNYSSYGNIIISNNNINNNNNDNKGKNLPVGVQKKNLLLGPVL